MAELRYCWRHQFLLWMLELAIVSFCITAGETFKNTGSWRWIMGTAIAVVGVGLLRWRINIEDRNARASERRKWSIDEKGSGWPE